MPKRKTAPGCSSAPRATVSLSSLDAALDMLACETFTRLEGIKTKFEQAAGFDIDETAMRVRWEEAVKRYWVMKSIDDLCCGSAPSGREKGKVKALGEDAEGKAGGEGGMEMDHARTNGSARADALANGGEDDKGTDEHGRAIVKAHPGAVVLHGLNAEEEHEWRKWTPRIGDVVLVDTPNDGLWPGKIIDKKTYFIGRTQPKGNHFFPVRIYNPDMEPTLSIKSRLLPLSIRPIAPLLSPAPLLSAYNHATCPESFDIEAQTREYAAADRRAHPGLTDIAHIKAAKSDWNAFVNWVMNERRAEKLRNLSEERERRVRLMAASECREVYGGVGMKEGGGVNGANGRGSGDGGYDQMPTMGREKTFRTLAPSAFSSPARPAGREAGTEMTDMSRVRGTGSGEIEVDGDDGPNGDRGMDPADGQGGKRQRRSSLPLPATDLNPKATFPYTSIHSVTSTVDGDDKPASNSPSSSGLGIFNVPNTPSANALTSTPRRTSSPFRLRPGLGALSTAFTTPTRPLSPRRLEKRRGSGIMSAAAGYESPRRGSWTPPRILPSGDETAPFRRFSGGAGGNGNGNDMEDAAGTGVGGMWNRSFDFVSPLGSVRAGVIEPYLQGGAGGGAGMGIRTMSPLAHDGANQSHLNGTGGYGDGAHGRDEGAGANGHSRRGFDTPHIHALSLRDDQDATMDGSDSSSYALPFANGSMDDDNVNGLTRRHSECLEVVKEEEEEGEWTIVGPPTKRLTSKGAANTNGSEYSANGHSDALNGGSAGYTHSSTGRERAGSAPCPETPVSKGKSVLHVKDKRQRELMMTPTKPSASPASAGGQMGHVGQLRGMGTGKAGVNGNGGDDDVEL